VSDFKARQSSNRVARLLDEVSNTLRSQVDPLRDVTASDRVETERLAHENPVILALLDSLKNFVKNQAVPTADISTISANDSQRKFRHPSVGRIKNEKMMHRNIERISIAGVTARLSPLALHTYAEDFLRAGVSLEASDVPFSPVQHYLLARAVELALKAFLSAHGITLKELAGRSYGHSLAKLLRAAESHGITAEVSLGSEHVEEIQHADKYYSEKVFEYPVISEAIKGYPQKPNLVVLRSAAELLVTGIEALCLSADS